MSWLGMLTHQVLILLNWFIISAFWHHGCNGKVITLEAVQNLMHILIAAIIYACFSDILSALRCLPDGALNRLHDDMGPIHAAIGYHCEDSSIKILEFMFCFGLDVNLR